MRMYPFVLVCLWGLLGCSSSFNIGVPDDRVLDEADADELTQICEDVSAELAALWSGEWSHATCTALAVIGTGSDAECREARDGCVEGVMPLEVADCTMLNAAAFDACDSDVALVERCIIQRQNAVRGINDQISCASSVSDLLGVDLSDLDTPACDELLTECPAAAMFVSVQLPTRR